MCIFQKIKSAIAGKENQADSAIAKAGKVANEATDNKHAEKVGKAQESAKEVFDKAAGEDKKEDK